MNSQNDDTIHNQFQDLVKVNESPGHRTYIMDTRFKATEIIDGGILSSGDDDDSSDDSRKKPQEAITPVNVNSPSRNKGFKANPSIQIIDCRTYTPKDKTKADEQIVNSKPANVNDCDVDFEEDYLVENEVVKANTYKNQNLKSKACKEKNAMGVSFDLQKEKKKKSVHRNNDDKIIDIKKNLGLVGIKVRQLSVDTKINTKKEVTKVINVKSKAEATGKLKKAKNTKETKTPRTKLIKPTFNKVTKQRVKTQKTGEKVNNIQIEKTDDDCGFHNKQISLNLSLDLFRNKTSTLELSNVSLSPKPKRVYTKRKLNKKKNPETTKNRVSQKKTCDQEEKSKINKSKKNTRQNNKITKNSVLKPKKRISEAEEKGKRKKKVKDDMKNVVKNSKKIIKVINKQNCGIQKVKQVPQQANFYKTLIKLRELNNISITKTGNKDNSTNSMITEQHKSSVNNIIDNNDCVEYRPVQSNSLKSLKHDTYSVNKIMTKTTANFAKYAESVQGPSSRITPPNNNVIVIKINTSPPLSTPPTSATPATGSPASTSLRSPPPTSTPLTSAPTASTMPASAPLTFDSPASTPIKSSSPESAAPILAPSVSAPLISASTVPALQASSKLTSTPPASAPSTFDSPLSLNSTQLVTASPASVLPTSAPLTSAPTASTIPVSAPLTSAPTASTIPVSAPLTFNPPASTPIKSTSSVSAAPISAQSVSAPLVSAPKVPALQTSSKLTSTLPASVPSTFISLASLNYTPPVKILAASALPASAPPVITARANYFADTTNLPQFSPTIGAVNMNYDIPTNFQHFHTSNQPCSVALQEISKKYASQIQNRFERTSSVNKIKKGAANPKNINPHYLQYIASQAAYIYAQQAENVSAVINPRTQFKSYGPNIMPCTSKSFPNHGALDLRTQNNELHKQISTGMQKYNITKGVFDVSNQTHLCEPRYALPLLKQPPPPLPPPPAYKPTKKICVKHKNVLGKTRNSIPPKTSKTVPPKANISIVEKNNKGAIRKENTFTLCTTKNQSQIINKNLITITENDEQNAQFCSNTDNLQPVPPVTEMLKGLNVTITKTKEEESESTVPPSSSSITHTKTNLEKTRKNNATKRRINEEQINDMKKPKLSEPCTIPSQNEDPFRSDSYSPSVLSIIESIQNCNTIEISPVRQPEKTVPKSSSHSNCNDSANYEDLLWELEVTIKNS